MNDVRIPIIEPYRTIRLSLCAICEWHLPSAVLLDYFVSLEHALDEARGQGETFGPWRELSTPYGALVMIYKPSRNTVMVGLDRLQQLGFIEAHPANASNKGGYAKNSRNRYRLCTARVLQAVNEFRAVQYKMASMNAVQNDTAVPSYIEQQTRPNLNGSAVQNWTQDLVVDLDSNQQQQQEQKAPPPLIEFPKIVEGWLGRKPTGLEMDRLQQLAAQHGEQAVSAAIQDAAFKGGRTPKYVAAILEDKNPRPGTPAPRKYFVAPDEPTGPRMTVEEMRAIRRDIEAKRRLSDGGAS
jgi:hypothetical protein